MADRFTREKRSEIMSHIRGRDTSPEKLIRGLLHAQGYRFSLCSKRIPGSPDIVLSRHRKVVFVHGCFWHGHKGCTRASLPSTNVRFWTRKVTGNIARDARVRMEVRKLGWKSLVIWQCRTRNRKAWGERLVHFLRQDNKASNGVRQASNAEKTQ